MASVAKFAHIEAARVASHHPAMDIGAAKVKSVLLGVIASHTKSGDLARSIRVIDRPTKSGVVDRLVESTDPNILSIEYGHWWYNPRGELEWVEGIRVFWKAFGILKAGG